LALIASSIAAFIAWAVSGAETKPSVWANILAAWKMEF